MSWCSANGICWGSCRSTWTTTIGPGPTYRWPRTHLSHGVCRRRARAVWWRCPAWVGSITNTSGERREPMGRISGRHTWRAGYHVLEIGASVHTVVLRLPDNGRNLVAPGCVECRALPHFALWCAAKVRDYWRRSLRIPCPPLINLFFNFIRIIGVDYSARRRGCAASTGCGSGARAARTYGCRRRRVGKSEDAADPEESTRITRASHPRQPCSPTRGRPPGEMADAARRAMQAGGAGSASPALLPWRA